MKSQDPLKPWRLLISHQIHVHGNAQGNIVFGVQDNARINPAHVFLRKSVSPNFYVDCMIGELMKKATKSIVIFGHSIGATDHTHFSPFFGRGENINCSNIEIHYHSEKSYYDIFQQIEKMTNNSVQRFRALHNFKMIGPALS